MLVLALRVSQECYPYMAKRLMTDDSPRSRKALRDMLVSGNGVIASDKLFGIAVVVVRSAHSFSLSNFFFCG